jgi:predicted nucleic acid-binding protein
MRGEARAVAWFRGLPAGEPTSISAITHCEILYGIRRLPPVKRRITFDESYADVFSRLARVFPVDQQVADLHAGLRANLEASGIVLPVNDLWIAATALHHDLPVVTLDSHFDFVPGLRILNWTREEPNGSQDRSK